MNLGDQFPDRVNVFLEVNRATSNWNPDSGKCVSVVLHECFVKLSLQLWFTPEVFL